jgi:parallel beta-helix repeat protein
MKKQIIILGIVAFALFLLAIQAFPFGGVTAPDLAASLKSTSLETATLEQVEPRIPISNLPFVITNPGSYYLTSNLSLDTPDQNGIEVDANDVTIDLMGFSLLGAGGMDGISINGKTNVEIRNGTISYWDNNGIYEKGGSGHRIKNVRLAWNYNSGIFLSGIAHTVIDCIAAQNGGYGIALADGSILDRNTAIGNNLGIYAGTGCTVTNNNSLDNWAAGMQVQSGCLVTGNTLNNNQWPDFLPPPTDINISIGIIVDGLGNTVKSNTLRGNPDTGILVNGTHNAIEDNLVTDAQNGIYFKETGNFYANNRASQNTTNYRNAPSSNSPGDGGGNAAF